MPLLPFSLNAELATATQKKLAVLIDADNAQSVNISGLLNEVAKYGDASVKRIYGDWTNTRLNSWKKKLLEWSIQPIQQFAYTTGKNATDSAMIIDAMDLLYSQRLDGFCIVSSDSDFTRLVSRLREAGMTVYGFGERKTPKAFVSACNKFIYTDILSDEVDDDEAGESCEVTADGAAPNEKPRERQQRKPRAQQKIDEHDLKTFRDMIDNLADESGWAYLATVGQKINNRLPEFDPRNYGFRKLGDLFRAHTKDFETEERVQENGGGRQVVVRCR